MQCVYPKSESLVYKFRKKTNKQTINIQTIFMYVEISE